MSIGMVVTTEGGIGMNGKTSTHTRCPICGRPAVSRGTCSACGSILLREQQEILASAPSSLVSAQPFELSSTAGNQQRLATSVTEPAGGVLNDAWLGIAGSETSGRVIIARQAPHEPMDFDPWRWVAIPVWGLLLLVSFSSFTLHDFGEFAPAHRLFVNVMPTWQPLDIASTDHKLAQLFAIGFDYEDHILLVKNSGSVFCDYLVLHGSLSF